jgi:uncharacterized membrane protein YhaH (DUF805 family)
MQDRHPHPDVPALNDKPGAATVRKFCCSKPVLFTAGALGLWHFGDVLLGTLLHALHVVIEVLEMGLEHLLEALFHLEGHDAQMATAWIGLALILILVTYTVKRLRQAWRSRFPSWQQFFEAVGTWTRSHWNLWLPPVLALTITTTLL